jgi:hypothetical protein
MVSSRRSKAEDIVISGLGRSGNGHDELGVNTPIDGQKTLTDLGGTLKRHG